MNEGRMETCVCKHKKKQHNKGLKEQTIKVTIPCSKIEECVVSVKTSKPELP